MNKEVAALRLYLFYCCKAKRVWLVLEGVCELQRGRNAVRPLWHDMYDVVLHSFLVLLLPYCQMKTRLLVLVFHIAESLFAEVAQNFCHDLLVGE